MWFVNWLEDDQPKCSGPFSSHPVAVEFAEKLDHWLEPIITVAVASQPHLERPAPVNIEQPVNGKRHDFSKHWDDFDTDMLDNEDPFDSEWVVDGESYHDI